MAVWQGYIGYVLLVVVVLLIVRKRFPMTEHNIGKIIAGLLMGTGVWRLYEYVNDAGSALNMTGIMLIGFITFAGAGFYWWHTRPPRGDPV
jgi:Mg2+/citrate symporter